METPDGSWPRRFHDAVLGRSVLSRKEIFMKYELTSLTSDKTEAIQELLEAGWEPFAACGNLVLPLVFFRRQR
jgi:hypothetical protein